MKKTLSILIFSLLFASCSTELTFQPLKVNGPPGALVYVDGMVQGKAPCTVSIISEFPNHIRIGEYRIILFPDSLPAMIEVSP